MSLTMEQTLPTPCPPPRYPQNVAVLATPQFGLKIAPSRGVKLQRPARGGAGKGWDPTLDIFEETAKINAQTGSSGQQLRYGTVALSEQVQEINSANIRKRRTPTSVSPRNQLPRAPESTVDLKIHDAVAACEVTTERTAEMKKARRRTIYIPADDTTMLTIHPGALLREKAKRPRGARRSDVFLDLAAQAEEDTSNHVVVHSSNEGTGYQAQRGSLTTAPRRAPLALSRRVTQVNGIVRDVAGVGGGKENLPPGWSTGKVKKDADVVVSSRRSSVSASSKKAMQSCAILQARSNTRMLDSMPQHAKSKLSYTVSATSPERRKPSPQNRITRTSTDLGRESPALTRLEDAQTLRMLPPARQPIALEGSLKQATSAGQYSVLCESVAMPALYTSGHLTSQEIALSQVFNDIYGLIGHNTQTTRPYADVRKEMMSLYHTEETLQLQQRLKASLQFGALGISKMALDKVSRIKDDVAQRQSFLDLWTKTYDLELLQAGAEVVMGRQINKTARISSSAQCSTVNDQRQTKMVQAFLRSFLLGNEDTSKTHGSSPCSRAGWKTADDDVDSGSPAWFWRRTVARSLLLIRLLDQFAMINNGTISNTCLFQKTSPHKSSSSMLQAIGSVLIPSIGDPSRILNHLKYNVHHVQQPLNEYTFRVTNPAVDFRDGLLLGRLIDILLTDEAEGSEVPTTLTSKLHCPALTRPHKLHNVKMALSTMTKYSHVGTPALQIVLDTIKAEDIVDGHREKTLSLLWTLVLDCGGLDMLVPRHTLEAEIRRIQRSAHKHGVFEKNTDSTKLTMADLLTHWAYHCKASSSTPNPTLTLTKVDDISAHLTNPSTRHSIFSSIVSEYYPSHSEHHDNINNNTVKLLERSGYHDAKFLSLYTGSAAVCDGEKGEGEVDWQSKETVVASLGVLARVLLVG